MLRVYFCLCLLPLVATCQSTTQNQNLSEFDEAIPMGPGITSPRPLSQPKPEYTPQAKANRIQGTVILEVVINEKGQVSNTSVISPLGFGLDEAAQAAVSKWKFSPGSKDGKPVKIHSTIEVNFELSGIRFDEKHENQRTQFNIAIKSLGQTSARSVASEKSLKSILELSGRGFPPAMYVLGTLKIEGKYFPKDPTAGVELIQQAAAKNYGPALYEIGARQIEGRDLPADFEKGIAKLRQASNLGEKTSQFLLGDWYETGKGVPRDLERARHYFNSCAALGVAMCQYRLGKLLLETPNRRERDKIQAVAWLELAAGQQLEIAKELALKEATNLSALQKTRMNSLKSQLVPKVR